MQQYLWYFIVFCILGYLIYDEYRTGGKKAALQFIIIFFAMFYIVQTYIVKPFLVDGPSMQPTFESSNYLLVERFSVRFGEIKRGDVIVFDIPENEETRKNGDYHTCYIPYGSKCLWTSKRYLIKRVLGLPGEKVVIINGVTTIYNSANKEGFVLNDDYVKYPSYKDAELTLGEDEYFVMGDNRMFSYDSRSWGVLPKDRIIGTPILRLFPINQIDFFPGKIKFDE